MPWLAAVPSTSGWGGVKGLWGQSELPVQVGDGNGRWRNHRSVAKGLGWVSLAKKRFKRGSAGSLQLLGWHLESWWSYTSLGSGR